MKKISLRHLKFPILPFLGPDYGYPPARDSRTLTWDRNPKPDRNDPKYFPVNSLPRHPGNGQRQVGPGTVPPGVGVGPGGPVNQNSINSPGMPIEEGMPPPMRELNSIPAVSGSWGPTPNDYPVAVSAGGINSAGPPQGPPPGDFYNAPVAVGGGAPVGGQVESEPGPGRGQRLLQRMAQQDHGGYGPNVGPGGGPNPVGSHPGTNGNGPAPVEQQRYSTLQYQRGDQRQYPRGAPNGGMVPGPPPAGRSRHYSGMDYASDTEALQSPVLSVRGGMRSMVDGRGRPTGGSRTNSLPRTFQREALLRHPELSMEMDRLASPSSGLPMGMGPHEDPMSDSGIISAPENMHSGIRGKRGNFYTPQINNYLYLI